LIFNRNKFELVNYWHLNFKPDYSKSNVDFTNEFIEKLKHSVELQSYSDAPMGCLLSGGLDSSLITAFLAEAGNNRIKTIFVSPGEGYWNESIYAKEVANLYSTDHIKVMLPKTFDQEYEKIINSFDEPFAHPTMLLHIIFPRNQKNMLIRF